MINRLITKIFLVILAVISLVAYSQRGVLADIATCSRLAGIWICYLPHTMNCNGAELGCGYTSCPNGVASTSCINGNTDCRIDCGGSSGGAERDAVETYYMRVFFYNDAQASYRYLNETQVGFMDPRGLEGATGLYFPRIDRYATSYRWLSSIDDNPSITNYTGLAPNAPVNGPVYSVLFQENKEFGINLKIYDAFYIENNVSWFTFGDEANPTPANRSNTTYLSNSRPYMCLSPCSGAECFSSGFCEVATTKFDDLSTAAYFVQTNGLLSDGGGSYFMFKVKKSIMGRVLGINTSTGAAVGLANITVLINPGSKTTTTDAQGYFRLNDPALSNTLTYTVSVTSAAPSGYSGAAVAIKYDNWLASSGTVIPNTTNNSTATNTNVGGTSYTNQRTTDSTDCSSLQGGEVGRCVFAYFTAGIPATPKAPKTTTVSENSATLLRSKRILPNTNLYGQYDFAICNSDKRMQFDLTAYTIDTPVLPGNVLTKTEMWYRKINDSTTACVTTPGGNPWCSAYSDTTIATQTWSSLNTLVTFTNATPGFGYYYAFNGTTQTPKSCSANPTVGPFPTGGFYYCGSDSAGAAPLTDTAANKPWGKFYVVKDAVAATAFTASTTAQNQINLNWNLPAANSDTVAYALYRDGAIIASIKPNQNSYTDIAASGGLVCDSGNTIYTLRALTGYNLDINSGTWTSNITYCQDVSTAPAVNATGFCNTPPVCTLTCKQANGTYAACNDLLKYPTSEQIYVQGICTDANNDVITKTWSASCGSYINDPANVNGKIFTTSASYNMPCVMSLTGTDTRSGSDTEQEIFRTVVDSAVFTLVNPAPISKSSFANSFDIGNFVQTNATSALDSTVSTASFGTVTAAEGLNICTYGVCRFGNTVSTATVLPAAITQVLSGKTVSYPITIGLEANNVTAIDTMKKGGIYKYRVNYTYEYLTQVASLQGESNRNLALNGDGLGSVLGTRTGSLLGQVTVADTPPTAVISPVVRANPNVEITVTTNDDWFIDTITLASIKNSVSNVAISTAGITNVVSGVTVGGVTKTFVYSTTTKSFAANDAKTITFKVPYANFTVGQKYNINVTAEDSNGVVVAVASASTYCHECKMASCGEILNRGTGLEILPNTSYATSFVVPLQIVCTATDIDGNAVTPTYSWTATGCTGAYSSSTIATPNYTMPSTGSSVCNLTSTVTNSALALPPIVNTITIVTPSYYNNWSQLFDGGLYSNTNVNFSGSSIAPLETLIGNADAETVSATDLTDIYTHFGKTNKYNSGGLFQVASVTGLASPYGQSGKNFPVVNALVSTKNVDLGMAKYRTDTMNQITGTYATALPETSKFGGSLVISSPITYTFIDSTKNVAYIGITGDLTINANITSPAGKTIVFIVGGNVIVGPAVTKVGAVFIVASGNVNIQNAAVAASEVPAIFNGGIIRGGTFTNERDLPDTVAYDKIPSVRILYDPNLIAKSAAGTLPAAVGVSNVYWVISD